MVKYNNFDYLGWELRKNTSFGNLFHEPLAQFQKEKNSIEDFSFCAKYRSGRYRK